MNTLSSIDHDRLFKELLTTFFYEFLELFFPEIAVEIDPGSITFLDKEIFLSLFEGKEIEADLVAQVRFRQNDLYFLVHIENQSTKEKDFPRRMFRYFTGLFGKYDLPIYPIAIFSYDAPKLAEPAGYNLALPGLEVIRYRYRTIQLNRLPWRRFMSQQNPVASALMSKMRIAERDRPRVKLECLRLLTTLKLDPARMRLISGFVDTYLRLSAAEARRFERAISGSDLIPEQKEQVMEIVTSWMETGIERGMAQGIERGMAQGRTMEAQSTLLRLGSKRFGTPEAAMTQKIEGATLTELEAMIDRLFEAQSWQEVLAN